jgi:osmotically-inducible protein OsmY
MGVTMKKNNFFWLLILTSALTFFVAAKDVVWAQPASAPSTSTKQSATQDDSAIAAAVQSTLQKEKWMSGTDIHATAKDGIVTLSGPARSHAEVTRAVQVARKVPGVTKAKSQIKVLPMLSPSDFAK